MTYAPVIQHQLDGSRCSSTNCNCVAHAIAVDRDWLGARKGFAPTIRDVIHLYCPGTTNAQNDTAIRSLYGTIVDRRYGVPWSAIPDALESGRGVVLIIDYDTVKGTPFDGNPNYHGNHAVYLQDRRWNANLNRYEILVYDPLADGRRSWIPKGPNWWPESIVKRGVDLIGVTDCDFTRDTVSNVKKVLYPGGVLRAKPTKDGPQVMTLPVGVLCVTGSLVPGGGWSVKGRTGSRWFPITKVGQSVLAKTLYAPRGWFMGPTGADG